MGLICTIRQAADGFHYAWVEVEADDDSAEETLGVRTTFEGAMEALAESVRRALPVGTLAADDELPNYDQRKDPQSHAIRRDRRRTKAETRARLRDLAPTPPKAGGKGK